MKHVELLVSSWAITETLKSNRAVFFRTCACATNKMEIMEASVLGDHNVLHIHSTTGIILIAL
jgi:hypothetical protein